MTTAEEVRRMALSLEGAVERDHHGFPSFRTAKIFATMPDDERLHVMLPEEQAQTVVAVHNSCTEELWWGKKIVGVRVFLSKADQQLVAELLRDAHRLASTKRPRS